MSTRKQTNERGDLMMDTCRVVHVLHVHTHTCTYIHTFMYDVWFLWSDKIPYVEKIHVEDRVRDVYVCESR